MRINKVVKKLLGLGREVVVEGVDLVEGGDCDRPKLIVDIRPRAGGRLRCGRCATPSPRYDRGDSAWRRWRHLDVGFATCELRAPAPRVACPTHGPTVAALAWARHDSAFTRAFEDLVVYDALASSKQRSADRHGICWRAVNNACERLVAEALGRVDLLDGLVAVAIDEVKYKKGQRYLTVVCDHFSGKVVWAAKGRTKEVVGQFFDALGPTRAAALRFVSCDGAEWIRAVVGSRAPEATICLDTFHVVSWATEALDEVRRGEWNALRRSGQAPAAKQLKGLRYVLLRNWENLSARQRSVIRELDRTNRRLLRAWQLKEELREIFSLPLLAARRALDDWLSYASRSRLAPFVRLARSIRAYRQSIEATIEWRLTNGIAESVNASIARVRANARGFHDAQAFITMVMLDRSGIAPRLPWESTAS